MAPGAGIENLLGSSIILAKDGEYLQVVDVFAEAIQANPTTAVRDSWLVNISGSEIVSAN